MASDKEIKAIIETITARSAELGSAIAAADTQCIISFGATGYDENKCPINENVRDQFDDCFRLLTELWAATSKLIDIAEPKTKEITPEELEEFKLVPLDYDEDSPESIRLTEAVTDFVDSLYLGIDEEN